jgi:hypothetical protein
MTTAPKRRWFAYSLRTLFVVVTAMALLLAWVAHARHWIQQRHEFLEVHRAPPPNAGCFSLPAEPLRVTTFSGIAQRSPQRHKHERFVLWAFGEQENPKLDLVFRAESCGSNMIESAQNLFPEADIKWVVVATRR